MKIETKEGSFSNDFPAFFFHLHFPINIYIYKYIYNIQAARDVFLKKKGELEYSFYLTAFF